MSVALAAADTDGGDALPPDYLSLDSPLATQAEAAQVEALRAAVDGDAGRLERWRDFDEVVGDTALLRYLRGHNHNVAQAAAVLEEHLRLRDALGLDAVREKVIGLRTMYDQMDFTHGAEVAASMPFTFNCGFSPHGHVITYVPVGRQDSKVLWRDVGLDKFRKFCIEEWVARDIQLARLSRERGRLVKIILVVDLAGLGISSPQVTHGAKKQFDKDWQKILETKPETTVRWFFINVPWFGRKLFNTFGKVTFPKNTLRKIELFGTDFREQLLGKVDLQTLEVLMRQAAGSAAAEVVNAAAGSETSVCDSATLAAGEIKDVLVPVPAKGTVSWEAAALTRDVGIGAIFYSEEGKAGGAPRYGEAKVDGGGGGAGAEAGGAGQQVVAAARKIAASDGAVRNTFTAPRPGLFCLQLSNAHSWMRSNDVRFAVTVTPVPPDSPTELAI